MRCIIAKTNHWIPKVSFSLRHAWEHDPGDKKDQKAEVGNEFRHFKTNVQGDHFLLELLKEQIGCGRPGKPVLCLICLFWFALWLPGIFRVQAQICGTYKQSKNKSLPCLFVRGLLFIFSGNMQSAYDTEHVGRQGFHHWSQMSWVPDGFSALETEGYLQMDLDL